MADKGQLRVGDELFSVDNLCCAFTPDRPLMVPSLMKLHQLLDRLTQRQRPVEVKVYRGRKRGVNGMSLSFYSNTASEYIQIQAMGLNSRKTEPSAVRS